MGYKRELLENLHGRTQQFARHSAVHLARCRWSVVGAVGVAAEQQQGDETALIHVVRQIEETERRLQLYEGCWSGVEEGWVMAGLAYHID